MLWITSIVFFIHSKDNICIMKHSVNGGKRTPVRDIRRRAKRKPQSTSTSWVILIIIILVILFLYAKTQELRERNKIVYKAPQTQIQEKPAEVVKHAPKTQNLKPQSGFTHKRKIAKKIADTFPEYPVIMVAIALAENKTLDPEAVGYNCFYKIGGTHYDPITKRYIDHNSVSRTRLPGYISTVCAKGHQKYAWSTDGGILQVNDPDPEHFTIDGNLKLARERYEENGLDAWTTYRTNKYKENLALAEELLK